MIDFVFKDHIGFIELIDSMGNDLSIVNAARVSLGNKSEEFTNRDAKLIRYLLENSHSSPLEHVTFTFHVKLPLPIARQWYRHRTSSYSSFNEISRRYTSENIEYFVPDEFRKQAKIDRQASDFDNKFSEEENQMFYDVFLDVINFCEQKYSYLLESGVAREQARMVLPQNMYTEFYQTVNLWNLFHFMDLRNSEHAQYEIKVYADAIERLIEPIVPSALSAWRELRKTEIAS